MALLRTGAAAAHQVHHGTKLQQRISRSIIPFLDLFPSEAVMSAGGLAVKPVVVLFTDIKGSTALYESPFTHCAPDTNAPTRHYPNTAESREDPGSGEAGHRRRTTSLSTVDFDSQLAQLASMLATISRSPQDSNVYRTYRILSSYRHPQLR